MKSVALRQHRRRLPRTAKAPVQSREHTLAAILGRGSREPPVVTLATLNRAPGICNAVRCVRYY